MPDSKLQDQALGLLETHGLVAAVEGADAMLKAARVTLLNQEVTMAALITTTVTGETAAVRAAVDAGRAAAERVGTVVSAHVIPRPGPGLERILEPDPETAKPRPSALADLTVRELRARARDLDDFPLSGRDISRASKDELVQALQGR